ncbi:MAG TPA: GNAT family protein [Mucilaginibacter sp.]|jgi:RimJ/RimL family protein N-acetyltransferase|nr:GNAT family protein [Mucilaginibacter sp.]
MRLVPVKEHLHENEKFLAHPECSKNVGMCVDFYKKIGFNPPWICYYAELDGEYVGGFAFKGKPVNNRVELAYVVFPDHQNKGIGSRGAKELVKLAEETAPGVIVTARTLPEENYSVRLLRKNNFKWLGVVEDPEDGTLWEWEYQNPETY